MSFVMCSLPEFNKIRNQPAALPLGDFWKNLTCQIAFISTKRRYDEVRLNEGI
jgi:hypothetical protein